MLPAKTGPADTPMPKSTGSRRNSAPSARAVANAAEAGSSMRSGAPNTASAASPWNLLTSPLPRVDFVDDDPEEVVEHLGDLVGFAGGCQLRRAHQIDEQDRDVALVSGNRFVLVDRATDHLLADVAAEQVPQPVTFLQSGDHAVESRLQLAEFGSLIDVDHVVNVSAFHLRHRVDDLVHRIRNRRRHQNHRAQTQYDSDERKHQHREPRSARRAG